jgi:hypothetical protein
MANPGQLSEGRTAADLKTLLEGREVDENYSDQIAEQASRSKVGQG